MRKNTIGSINVNVLNGEMSLRVPSQTKTDQYDFIKMDHVENGFTQDMVYKYTFQYINDAVYSKGSILMTTNYEKFVMNLSDGITSYLNNNLDELNNSVKFGTSHASLADFDPLNENIIKIDKTNLNHATLRSTSSMVDTIGN